MTVILPATARRARRTQREHDAAEGGWWCKQCHRDGLGKIAAGKCDQYAVAEGLLVAFDAQCVTRPRGRAPVGRYWARLQPARSPVVETGRWARCGRDSQDRTEPSPM